MLHRLISCSLCDSLFQLSFHPRAEGGVRKENRSVGLCRIERVNCTRKQNLVLEFPLLLLEISKKVSVCREGGDGAEAFQGREASDQISF